jgi:hypothetical protein
VGGGGGAEGTLSAAIERTRQVNDAAQQKQKQQQQLASENAWASPVRTFSEIFSMANLCGKCPCRQRRHKHASLDGLPLLPWMVCKQPRVRKRTAAPCAASRERDTKKVLRHCFLLT